MSNEYVGREVTIASSDQLGISTPHIDMIVDSRDDFSSAYYRADFNPVDGVVQSYQKEFIRAGYCDEIRRLPESRKNSRKWGHTESLFEKKPAAEAKASALAEAQRRNVALYETVYTPKYQTTVLWHPDGWEPRSEV